MRPRFTSCIAALVRVQCQTKPPPQSSEPPPSVPLPRAPSPTPSAAPPPSPSAAAAPPSRGIEQTAPQFEVRLAPGGITVVRDGKDVGTVGTLEELPTMLPKHPGDGDIVVRADPAMDYQELLLALDALRNLGYDNVSFAARR